MNVIKNVVFLLAILLYSSQSGLDKSVVNDNTRVDTTRGAIDRSSRVEEIIYPKGVVPEWVKDSLSEEGYRIVCKLSEKYEMSYYPISKYKNARTFDMDKNQEAVDWLLNAPSLEDEGENTFKMVSDVPRLKDFNSESVDNTGEVEDKQELCSQTHNIYEKKWGLGLFYIDVSAGYIYHPVKKIATDIRTLNVTVDAYGLTFDIHWQERSTLGNIVSSGKNLDLHVDGCLKTKIQIEGLVGSDLVITSINKTYNYAVEPGHNDDFSRY